MVFGSIGRVAFQDIRDPKKTLDNTVAQSQARLASLEKALAEEKAFLIEKERQLSVQEEVEKLGQELESLMEGSPTPAPTSQTKEKDNVLFD